MKKIMGSIALWMLGVSTDDVSLYFSLQDKLRNSPLNKRVRRCFYFFFYSDGYDNIHIPTYNQLGIIDIISKQRGDMLYIIVVLERPGLLIGKAGSTIDSFKQYLQGEFKLSNDKLKLDVKESKMWVRMF